MLAEISDYFAVASETVTEDGEVAVSRDHVASMAAIGVKLEEAAEMTADLLNVPAVCRPARATH